MPRKGGGKKQKISGKEELIMKVNNIKNKLKM